MKQHNKGALGMPSEAAVRARKSGGHDMADNVQVKNPSVENTRSGRHFAPRVDIYENDHELLLYADLPGVAAGDVDLRYERGELTLQGKAKLHEHAGQPILGEYEVGDYYRVFQIHESIDASKIEAEHKNGVLTVHLPKQEAVKPKLVSVRS
jgi:HSP20 family molecular chaperone IbpA